MKRPPFPTNMEQFDDFIKWLIQVDYDCMILVTGGTGEGKSSLAWKLGKRWDPTFKPEQVVFDVESMARMTAKMEDGQVPPGRVIILDEAILGAFASDHQTKENKAFAKFLIVCRDYNAILLVLAPKVDQIAKQVRERARFMVQIHEYERGRAVVKRRMPQDYLGASLYFEPLFGLPYTKVTNDPEWMVYKKMKRQQMDNRVDDLFNFESKSGRDPKLVEGFENVALSVASRNSRFPTD